MNFLKKLNTYLNLIMKQFRYNNNLTCKILNIFFEDDN